jgi:hypothetical protein
MPNNQEQATALLSQIPFGAIIGGPLKAAVEAQAAAAIACYDFVSKIGFTDEKKKDAQGNVVVVNGQEQTYRKCTDIVFTFEREAQQLAASAGSTTVTAQTNPPQKVVMTLTVPVLTIMPIPYIRIESMTVNFKASISAVDTQSTETKESTDKEGKLQASVGFALWKASVSGGISSKKDSTATSSSKYSVEHTMDISVHAVQDDMPAGMAKLLDFMTRSIVAGPAS